MLPNYWNIFKNLSNFPKKWFLLCTHLHNKAAQHSSHEYKEKPEIESEECLLKNENLAFILFAHFLKIFTKTNALFFGSSDLLKIIVCPHIFTINNTRLYNLGF